MTKWEKVYVALGVIGSCATFVICNTVADNLEGWLRIVISVLAAVNLAGTLGLMQCLSKRAKK